MGRNTTVCDQYWLNETMRSAVRDRLKVKNILKRNMYEDDTRTEAGE